MSRISDDQLKHLTDKINERLAEFGDFVFTPTTLGVVRIAYTVFDEFRVDCQRDLSLKLAEALARQAEENEQRIEFTITNNAATLRDSDAPAESEIAIADSGLKIHADGGLYVGPEPVLGLRGVPVIIPEGNALRQAAAPGVLEGVTLNGKPIPVDDDADRDERMLARLGSEEKAAMLRGICYELCMVAVGGEMPTQSEWNERKPANMPRSAAILHRYNLSWAELAEYAGLSFDADARRRRRHADDKEGE